MLRGLGCCLELKKKNVCSAIVNILKSLATLVLRIQSSDPFQILNFSRQFLSQLGLFAVVWALKQCLLTVRIIPKVLSRRVKVLLVWLIDIRI